MGLLLQALLSAVVILKDRRGEGMERVLMPAFLRTKNINQEAVPNIETGRGRERRAVKVTVFVSLLP